MAIKNKGLNTFFAISTAAKQLFYENGYKQTTIKEICSRADVKLGTFTHYFPTSKHLLMHVYSDIIMNTYRFVETNTIEKLDGLQKNFCSCVIHYQIMLGDEKNRKFHYEVISNESYYTLMSINLKRIYQSFLKDFDLDVSARELSRISSADLGVRRELMLEFLEGKITDSPIELSVTILGIMGRLFKIDQEIIDSHLAYALAFEKEKDYSRIKFLV